MRLRVAFALASVAALAGALRAQGVPYGEHIVSIFSNVTSSTTGLLFVDRVANSCKPITGLSQAAQEANAVQLDPVNETVWVGTLSTGELYRISIDASCNVSSETLWGAATTTSSTIAGIQAITFDNNGDPLCAVAGNVGGAGDGIWQFQRNNPGPATLLQAATGINALCRDPAGNLYYGLATGSLFMMPVQPDCTYGSPILLGTITPASNSAIVSGVDYCTPDNTLWWTSFGTNGTSIGSFALPGGPAATSTASGLPALNAIEFDVMRQDFTVVTAGADPDTVFGVSKNFATTTECVIPPNGANGVPSGIDACDCTTAETLVAPRCLTGGATFQLDFATCCPPGMLAGVFLTQPLAIPLLVGTAPASGRLVVPPFITQMPPGTPPGMLTFQSACLDQSNNNLIVGPAIQWPDTVQ